MTHTEEDLLRVVYFSYQTYDTDREMMAWEIDKILEKSQFNNGRFNVTGALIFNSGVFGQVLEGPIDAVEETFERIQMDERHDHITVLDTSRITERSFPRWSMGFIGSDSVCAELFGEIGSKTAFDISRLSGQQIFETLHALTLKNEISDRAA
ncbi:BLUF domain-containing protein [Roseobacter sinensis]|uniref:BLUF domain-containing protein n=1 Tax=Roseobacter sinensis TaxID=2931391 RepID=A0ABT3BE36_9RHOB|nr:BLUF domain-containing protein [Roseobacter sp. WL0113]MCV3271833.1 BLUF domain-containing protein [Roseobacter sp. WL0113]